MGYKKLLNSLLNEKLKLIIQVQPFPKQKPNHPGATESPRSLSSGHICCRFCLRASSGAWSKEGVEQWLVHGEALVENGGWMMVTNVDG